MKCIEIEAPACPFPWNGGQGLLHLLLPHGQQGLPAARDHLTRLPPDGALALPANSSKHTPSSSKAMYTVHFIYFKYRYHIYILI